MLDSRKMTAEEKLYDKVKEYVNLAEGIVTDDMDVNARYQALAGLYKHIDKENGGYIDLIRNAPDIDGVNQKKDGSGEHGTGNALSRFIKYAKEKFHEIKLESVDGNGVEHYVFGLDWHPQKGFEEARELLFMLLTVIGYDGEFYWKQIKIRTGNELPKFWEGREKTVTEMIDELRNANGKIDDSVVNLGDDIRNRFFDIGPTSIGLDDLNTKFQRQYEEAKAKQQPIIDKLNNEIQAAVEEAKRKAKEAFPFRFAGVAPDGRPIWVDSEDVVEIKETKNNNNMIAKGKPTPDSVETGNEQFLSSKLFRYAKDIKKRLDMAGEMRGTDKEKTKYDSLNWMLGKIFDESGEYVWDCRNMPTEEYQVLYDSCCFEDEELSSLSSFVDMILEEYKRVLENAEHCSWLQDKTNGYYKSTLVLCVLVAKLEYELKDSYSLLESANCRPDKPIAMLTKASTIKPPAKKKARDNKLPHYNLELPNDFDYEASQKRMTNGEYLDVKTTADEWKYVCTGDGEVPKQKLNWVGQVNELAKMAELFNAEKKVYGYFSRAAKIFTIDGKDTKRENLKAAAKDIWIDDERDLRKALQGLICNQE